jgi:hypothetical protein
MQCVHVDFGHLDVAILLASLYMRMASAVVTKGTGCLWDPFTSAGQRGFLMARAPAVRGTVCGAVWLCNSQSVHA